MEDSKGSGSEPTNQFLKGNHRGYLLPLGWNAWGTMDPSGKVTVEVVNPSGQRCHRSYESTKHSGLAACVLAAAREIGLKTKPVEEALVVCRCGVSRRIKEEIAQRNELLQLADSELAVKENCPACGAHGFDHEDDVCKCSVKTLCSAYFSRTGRHLDQTLHRDRILHLLKVEEIKWQIRLFQGVLGEADGNFDKEENGGGDGSRADTARDAALDAFKEVLCMSLGRLRRRGIDFAGNYRPTHAQLISAIDELRG